MNIYKSALYLAFILLFISCNKEEGLWNLKRENKLDLLNDSLDLKDIIQLNFNVTDVNSNSFGFNITKTILNDDLKYYESGICYNKTGMPDINDSITWENKSITSGLDTNTEYYVRAYMKLTSKVQPNKYFIYYSSQKVVRTKDLIIQLDFNVTNINAITFDFNISKGALNSGLSYEESGICYNKTGMPNINNNKTLENLNRASGLDMNTEYYVRAFVKINNLDKPVGDPDKYFIYYSSQKVVRTKDLIIQLDFNVTNINAITFDFNISKGALNSGLSYEESGICYNKTGMPNINNNKTLENLNRASGLDMNTEYYVRAFVKINNLDKPVGDPDKYLIYYSSQKVVRTKYEMCFDFKSQSSLNSSGWLISNLWITNNPTDNAIDNGSIFTGISSMSQTFYNIPNNISLNFYAGLSPNTNFVIEVNNIVTKNVLVSGNVSVPLPQGTVTIKITGNDNNSESGKVISIHNLCLQ